MLQEMTVATLISQMSSLKASITPELVKDQVGDVTNEQLENHPTVKAAQERVDSYMANGLNEREVSLAVASLTDAKTNEVTAEWVSGVKSDLDEYKDHPQLVGVGMVVDGLVEKGFTGHEVATLMVGGSFSISAIPDNLQKLVDLYTDVIVHAKEAVAEAGYHPNLLPSLAANMSLEV